MAMEGWTRPDSLGSNEPGVSRVSEYEPVPDGFEALERVLDRAGYRTVLEAVVEHTVFLHPETVKQAKGEALFRIIRKKKDDPRPPDETVTLDDNTSPTLAFEWAAQQKRPPDVQFNHIYKRPYDPGCYTALWNICVTPAFLAKLTDTHHGVIAALKRRSFDLYDCLPNDEPEPEPPDGYNSLKKKWRRHPPPVSDLETVLRARLQKAPKSRPAKAGREIGWYFSGWEPDHTL